MTHERIVELEQKGFKRWTKGNIDRLYINASQLGLDCEYYKTGNIRYAEFRGEMVSNTQARKMKASRTYIDINTDRVYSDIELLKDAASELAGLDT